MRLRCWQTHEDKDQWQYFDLKVMELDLIYRIKNAKKKIKELERDDVPQRERLSEKRSV